jgi:hypothetical protein
MISLKIDGKLEPHDFIEILESIESFYYKLAVENQFHRRDPWWLDDHYGGWTGEQTDRTYGAFLDRINRKMLDRARFEASSYKRLIIARIHYASPGGIDLLGVGKVFDTIATSIGRIRVYFDEAHLRSERNTQASLDTELKRIAIEKERESLQELKIRNAKDALNLLDSYPGREELLLPLLVRDQDAIATKIAERKLISAEIVSSERGQNNEFSDC